MSCIFSTSSNITEPKAFEEKSLVVFVSDLYRALRTHCFSTEHRDKLLLSTCTSGLRSLLPLVASIFEQLSVFQELDTNLSKTVTSFTMKPSSFTSLSSMQRCQAHSTFNEQYQDELFDSIVYAHSRSASYTYLCPRRNSIASSAYYVLLALLVNGN